jgi:hypothetical protein
MKLLLIGAMGVGGVEATEGLIQSAATVVDGITPMDAFKLAIQLAIGLFTVYMQNRQAKRKPKAKTDGNS